MQMQVSPTDLEADMQSIIIQISLIFLIMQSHHIVVCGTV